MEVEEVLATFIRYAISVNTSLENGRKSRALETISGYGARFLDESNLWKPEQTENQLS